MSVVYLGDWKKDLSAAVPLTPRQAEMFLKAYRVAVTVAGIRPEEVDRLKRYIQDNTKQGPFLVGRFVDTLGRLARAGKVPYAVYDPSKGALAVIGKGVAATGRTVTGITGRLAVIAAVVGGLYLFVSTGGLRALTRGRRAG